MPLNYQFDARQFEPRQELPKHPTGKFQFQIADTAIVPTKEGNGQNFKITFRSQYGTVTRNYVIVHPNQQTVKIAFEQLSALCYAIGIPTIDFNQDGGNIRGAQLWGEVREQPNNHDFVELWKVFDLQGNEPGKAPTVATAPNPTPGHVPPQSSAYPVPGSSQMPQNGPAGAFPGAGATAPSVAPNFPAPAPAPAPGGAFAPAPPPPMPAAFPAPGVTVDAPPPFPGTAAPAVNWPGNAPGAVPPFAGGR